MNDFLCHGHMRKFTFSSSHLRFFMNFSSQNSYLFTHVNISLRSILSYVIMPKKKSIFHYDHISYHKQGKTYSHSYLRLNKIKEERKLGQRDKRKAPPLGN